VRHSKVEKISRMTTTRLVKIILFEIVMSHRPMRLRNSLESAQDWHRDWLRHLVDAHFVIFDARTQKKMTLHQFI